MMPLFVAFIKNGNLLRRKKSNQVEQTRQTRQDFCLAKLLDRLTRSYVPTYVSPSLQVQEDFAYLPRYYDRYHN